MQSTRTGKVLPLLLAICLVLGTIPLTATPVYAAATTYTVTSGDNASVGSGTSGTFRWCVEQANATSGTHTINFEKDLGITLTAPIEITRSMTINGNGSTITTNGMTDVSWGAVRTVKDSGAAVRIQRIRFLGCSLRTEGAALHNSAGNTMYVESCIFDGNHTNTNGGTGGAFANVGMAYVRGCTFYNNFASGYGGGGGGAIANYAFCEVYDNVFYGNYTTAGNAGETIKAFSSATGTLCYRNAYDDNTGGVNLVSPNDNFHRTERYFDTYTYRPTSTAYYLLDDAPRYYRYDFYGSDRTMLHSTVGNAYSIGAVIIPFAEEPTITAQPNNEYQTYYSVDAPDPLVVLAFSPDGGTLSYRWYQDGLPIPGATSARYAPPAPYKIGTTVFHCRITNSHGSWSSAYVDSVTVPIIFKPCFPTVTLNSGDAVYAHGETAAALSVTASTRDDGDLTYQWWKNTEPGSNGAIMISGANTAEYTPSTGEAGIMYYTCTVNNDSAALPNYTTGQGVPWVKITVENAAYFKIGAASYDTLQSALAAVQDGETIEMLRDAELSESAELNVNKTYTLDFGEYTLSGSDIGMLLRISAGNVTLKNGVLQVSSAYGAFVENGATVSIRSGDYSAVDDAVFCASGSTVIIVSGRFRETRISGDGALLGDGISLAPGSSANVNPWKGEGANDVTVTAAPMPQKGDTVYFGAYEQANDGGDGEPIAWKVLENAEGKLFLLSEKNLDVKPYHTDNAAVTWERSTIRSWLNGYGAGANDGDVLGIDYSGDGDSFIGTAFTEAERGFIATTSAVNDDKLFLLSLSEVTNANYGFTGDYNATDTRTAVNTAYVASLPGTALEGSTDLWWLRSPGDSENYAALVNSYGGVYTPGYPVNFFAVSARPALNLNLESVIFEYDESGNFYSVLPKSTYAFARSAEAGGTVSGTADGSYIQGAAISVTAVANVGYHFKNWTAVGITLADATAATVNFQMPANAVTLIANFEADGGGQPPATYAFARLAGTGGTVSGTADGSYVQGEAVSVTAAANSGYHFKNWTAVGITLPDATAATVNFQMPANAVTLIANFEADGGGNNNSGNGGNNGGGNSGNGNGGNSNGSGGNNNSGNGNSSGGSNTGNGNSGNGSSGNSSNNSGGSGNVSGNSSSNSGSSGNVSGNTSGNSANAGTGDIPAPNDSSNGNGTSTGNQDADASTSDSELADTDTPLADSGAQAEQDDTSAFPWWILAIVGAIVIAGIIILLVKRKK